MILKCFIIVATLQIVSGDWSCHNLKKHPNWKVLDRGTHCGQARGVEKGNGLGTRVLGGINTHPGEFPWMAAIFAKRNDSQVYFSCGGAVISDRYILTAAHCMVDKETFKVRDTLVRLGEYELERYLSCADGGGCSQQAVDMEVEKAIYHEEYKHGGVNDIGLLRLRDKITFTDYVLPICLPTLCSVYNNNFVGTQMTIAGWGNIDEVPEVKIVDKLQKAVVPVVPVNVCDYWGPMKDILCAGVPSTRDACHGDSGGPLMYEAAVEGPERYFIVGVVSGGDNCTLTNIPMGPGVYTRVAVYLPWILSKVHY